MEEDLKSLNSFPACYLRSNSMLITIRSECRRNLLTSIFLTSQLPQLLSFVQLLSKRSYSYILKIVAHSPKVILISAPTNYKCTTADVSRPAVHCNMHPLSDKTLSKSNYGEMSSIASDLIMGNHCTSSILNISLSWLFSGILLALEIF